MVNTRELQRGDTSHGAYFAKGAAPRLPPLARILCYPRYPVPVTPLPASTSVHHAIPAAFSISRCSSLGIICLFARRPAPPLACLLPCAIVYLCVHLPFDDHSPSVHLLQQSPVPVVP